MFGNLGFSEMIVIFAIALIVFGPRRLPEIARSIGRTLAQFRRAANDLRDTVEREVDAEEIKASIEQANKSVEGVVRAANDPVASLVDGTGAEKAIRDPPSSRTAPR